MWNKQVTTHNSCREIHQINRTHIKMICNMTSQWRRLKLLVKLIHKIFNPFKPSNQYRWLIIQAIRVVLQLVIIKICKLSKERQVSQDLHQEILSWHQTTTQLEHLLAHCKICKSATWTVLVNRRFSNRCITRLMNLNLSTTLERALTGFLIKMIQSSLSLDRRNSTFSNHLKVRLSTPHNSKLVTLEVLTDRLLHHISKRIMFHLIDQPRNNRISNIIILDPWIMVNGAITIWWWLISCILPMIPKKI